MSASDNLSPDQFHDDRLLHTYWNTPRGEHAVVPIEHLDNAYSHEFDVRGKDIEQGYASRLAEPVEYHEPNDHPDVQDALTKDVAQHGIQRPLYMGASFGNPNGPDHSIVDGSHRLLAAKRAGLTHVPVRYQ